AAEADNARAQLAIDILEYDILKYIGSYTAVLGGVDAIVFTAGIGENQCSHRSKVCHALEFMGVKIDDNLNDQMIRGKEGKISTPDSTVEVYVIPTNEELVIARDTMALVTK
ncbi:MAG: acetate kinase, partial [Clostridia bacterium]|nr:acetate kinase [Clostridia bacterium]